MTAAVKHKDGVPWHEAPVPPEDHECRHQTTGWIGVNQWARCACGAIADGLDLKLYFDTTRDLTDEQRKRYGTTVDRGLWLERNSRRRSDREITAEDRAEAVKRELLTRDSRVRITDGMRRGLSQKRQRSWWRRVLARRGSGVVRHD